MNKDNRKQLRLTRTTIRSLSRVDLDRIAGGRRRDDPTTSDAIEGCGTTNSVVKVCEVSNCDNNSCGGGGLASFIGCP